MTNQAAEDTFPCLARLNISLSSLEEYKNAVSSRNLLAIHLALMHTFKTAYLKMEGELPIFQRKSMAYVFIHSQRLYLILSVTYLSPVCLSYNSLQSNSTI